MQVEQVFDIRDAEHIAGTNRYVFKYPEHWRRIPNKQLTIGIRSIKLINYPISISMNNIQIVNKLNIQTLTSMNVNFTFQLNSNESFCGTSKMKQVSYDLWAVFHASHPDSKEFLLSDFNMENDIINQTLRIYGDPNTITNCFWFIMESRTSRDFNELVKVPNDFWLSFWIMYNQTKADAKTGQIDYTPYNNWSKLYKTELSHVDVLFRIPIIVQTDGQRYDPRYPFSFTFHNIPSRGDLLIKSSIPDQTTGQYLGYTNEKFEPIKYYPIHNSDSKFWIDLSDGITQISIELLPNDRIIIEAVVMTEPHLFK
jgi:hypothetical protein